MKQVREFFFTFPIRNYNANEVVIRLDEPITNIYYLVEGKVAQYATAADGSDFVVHIFRPGSFFPVAMAVADIPNRFSFKTMAKSAMHVAPTQKVVRFLERNPRVLFDLTRRLSQGLFGVVARLEKNLGSNANDRILSLLAYLSKAHGKETKEGRQIGINLTHQDIASWLGLSRETVTRQLRQLEKKRYISYTRKAIIVKRIGSRVQD